jgi:hypothetical protein
MTCPVKVTGKKVRKVLDTLSDTEHTEHGDKMSKIKTDLDWMSGVALSYAKWPKGMCQLMSMFDLRSSEMVVLMFLVESYPKDDWTDIQIANLTNMSEKTIRMALSQLADENLIAITRKSKRSGLSLKLISIAPLRKIFLDFKAQNDSEKQNSLAELKKREDDVIARATLPIKVPVKNTGTSNAELSAKLRENQRRNEHTPEVEPEVPYASLKSISPLEKEILDIPNVDVNIKQNFRESTLREGAVRFPTWRATRGECNLEAKLDELIRHRLTLPQFAQLGQHSEGFWGLIGEQLQNFADEKAKEMQIDFKHFYRDLNRAYDKYMNSLDDNAELLTMTEFHDGVIAGANYKWFDDITEYLPRKSLSEVELQERQTANSIEELLNANRQKSSDKEDLSNKDAAIAWLFEDESKTS